MREESIANNTPQHFELKYRDYSDDEIIAVLKKRDHYQKAAVEIAVQEAIQRGIVQSEQDLLSAEFNVKPMPFTLFPKIENEKVRLKTLKSMSRSLLILGSVPTIWGALKIYRGRLYEGLILLVLGLIWMFVSFQMMKNANSKGLFVLLLIYLAAVFYVSQLLWANIFTSAPDIFISAIFCLLILYGLLYLRKLG